MSRFNVAIFQVQSKAWTERLSLLSPNSNEIVHEILHKHLDDVFP
jgi:hypothetical protein